MDRTSLKWLMPARAGELGARAAAGLFAGLLWMAGNDGPDFGHYVEWAFAAVLEDIFQLGSNVRAPSGVPLTVVAVGPGLLFATVRTLVGGTPEVRTAAYLAGWIAALIFWGSAWVVLRRVAGGRHRLTAFALGALFVGTHAGFYSHEYSTEIFANAFIAALWALALARRGRVVPESLAAGALTGLLLLVRPYLVLYALPPLFLMWQERLRERRRRPPIAALGSMIVPLAIACAEYAVINSWMTGSWARPPYMFGGFGFQSVDLLNPEIAAVVAHSWHGWLTYHPLYAIGLAALAVHAWRERAYRLVCVAVLVSILAHLWVQSSWYIWWLGGGSFGMRGMAPAALPLMMALTGVIRRGDDAGRHRTSAAWIGAAVLCCIWSFPLLLLGKSSFFSWAELLDAQPLVLMLVAALVAMAIVVRMAGAPATNRTTEGTLLPHAAAALVALSLGYLLSYAGAMAGWRIVASLAVVAALLAPLPLRLPPFGRRACAIGAILVVFATQAWLMARLAIATERRLVSGAPPPREFRYAGTAPVDGLRVSYAEYRLVPGFEDRKAAFAAFLNWLQIQAAGMSRGERQLAEVILHRLASDPVTSQMLVQINVEGSVVKLAGNDTNDDQRSRARALAARVPGVTAVDDQLE